MGSSGPSWGAEGTFLEEKRCSSEPVREEAKQPPRCLGEGLGGQDRKPHRPQRSLQPTPGPEQGPGGGERGWQGWLVR